LSRPFSSRMANAASSVLRAGLAVKGNIHLCAPRKKNKPCREAQVVVRTVDRVGDHAGWRQRAALGRMAPITQTRPGP